MPDFVLPPFFNGTVRFPVGIRSFDVPAPSTSSRMTMIFRCTLFRQADVEMRNPAELAVWDQPFKTYCPKLYNATACSGGNDVSGYANVLLSLDGRDPDGSVPKLSLDSLVPLDGQPASGNVYVKEVKQEVVTDRMGRRIARIHVHALLRRDDCYMRYFRYRFRAIDDQGETAWRDVTLWVNPR
jgi:hypothetical protein